MQLPHYKEALLGYIEPKKRIKGEIDSDIKANTITALILNDQYDYNAIDINRVLSNSLKVKDNSIYRIYNANNPITEEDLIYRLDQVTKLVDTNRGTETLSNMTTSFFFIKMKDFQYAIPVGRKIYFDKTISSLALKLFPVTENNDFFNLAYHDIEYIDMAVTSSLRRLKKELKEKLNEIEAFENQRPSFDGSLV